MSSPMAKPVSMLSPVNSKKQAQRHPDEGPGRKRSATEQLTSIFQRQQQKVLKTTPTSTPLSTPALSLYSVLTSSSEDTELETELEDVLEHPSNATAPTSEQTNAPTTRHSEFGHCNNEAYRYLSVDNITDEQILHEQEQEPSYTVLLITYFGYLLLIIIGHIRDFVGKVFRPSNYANLLPANGYAALNSDFDSFYTRRLKRRLDDCFSRPVTGVPGRTIVVLDRKSEDKNLTFRLTGTRTRALNVSSYNYLGFAQGQGGCSDAVEAAIRCYGISSLGPRYQGGCTDLLTTAESLVARFVGMESAIITSIGFATNSSNIPALVSKGCLVISDEFNHASIRTGVRLSGASVRMFKHNDMNSLEKLLRECISQGQPRTHRPWKKILLIVEGLYSMEGTMCPLPKLLELKKKYKFYLFVDEAHSIGALGPHGRGVCDFFGVDPQSVDVLMGTFTKSFGASGGYIAGRKDFIDKLRIRSHSSAYAESIGPPVLGQILASMSSIMGVNLPGETSPGLQLQHRTTSSSSSVATVTSDSTSQPNGYTPQRLPSNLLPAWLLTTLPPSFLSGAEGSTRIKRLAFNARYLHLALIKLGFMTYGHPASPIIPLMLFQPGKMILFSQMMLQRRTRVYSSESTVSKAGVGIPIVVVVVSYPATTLTTARVRFCMSASHTKEDVDTVLDAVDEVGTLLGLKLSGNVRDRWTLEECKRRAVQLVERGV